MIDVNQISALVFYCPYKYRLLWNEKYYVEQSL